MLAPPFLSAAPPVCAPFVTLIAKTSPDGLASSETYLPLLFPAPMSKTKLTPLRALTITMFLVSGSLVLFELLLTRIFGVVLFSQFAHLALLLALLGISVGAVIQHVWPKILPTERLEARVAWVCLGQGAAMLIAVGCALNFPLTEQWDTALTDYATRGGESQDLVNLTWFGALLPMLMLPFCFAGLTFAAAFQHRKKYISQLYGADLIGGGAGAVIFLPALGILPVPDIVLICALAATVAAALLLRTSGSTRSRRITTGVVALLLVLIGINGAGIDLFKVKYAAGYSETKVLHTEWTALTRLAIHEDDQKFAKILLDNSSASFVIRDERDLRAVKRHANRSVVYQLHDPPARVAVIAASAGPEIAIAQSYGYENIDAIDIAGDIADLVARKFPDAPLNPYVHGNTNRIKADGRAAIMHARGKYDIIHMVHANLHSNAGMMATAWSSALLTTKDAFHTYFDRLSDDGTICFGKGGHTVRIANSAAAALRERGVKEPWKHIAYIKTRQVQFMMVKNRPWTVTERNRLQSILKGRHMNKGLYWDPTHEPNKRSASLFEGDEVMTDNRPYLDRRDLASNAIHRLSDPEFMRKEDRYLGRVYDMLLVQVLFVLLGGLLFLLVPLLSRGRAHLKQVNRVYIALLYVACLGYGYLAIETVLIHELILFVGHPTYAVTAVILSMLLFSGIGSAVAGFLKQETLTRSLTIILATIVVLASVQAWIIPDLLKTYALGYTPTIRIFITIAVLAPLGFAMGFPFPVGLRILPDRASAAIPWAWALNGWMSVVSSIATVLISRNFGYGHASAVAIAAYSLALLIGLGLRFVGRDSPRS